MELLTPESFTPHTGTSFRVVDADVPVTLRLDRVEVKGQGPQRQAFSLLFVAPPGDVLPQRIYTLEHESMGTLDIFIVPIASDAAGVTYEAVFA